MLLKKLRDCLRKMRTHLLRLTRDGSCLRWFLRHLLLNQGEPRIVWKWARFKGVRLRARFSRGTRHLDTFTRRCLAHGGKAE